jgi:hypothetical protein
MIVLEEFKPTDWPVSLVDAGQWLLCRKRYEFLDFTAPRLTAKLSRNA